MQLKSYSFITFPHPRFQSGLQVRRWEKHDARGVVRGFLPVSDEKGRNPLYFRPKSAMLFIYRRFTAAGKKEKTKEVRPSGERRPSWGKENGL